MDSVENCLQIDNCISLTQLIINCQDMSSRRDFLKTAAGVTAAAAVGSMFNSCERGSASKEVISGGSGLIVPHANAIPITGTFLDEISHDIPHQNWGAK